MIDGERLSIPADGEEDRTPHLGGQLLPGAGFSPDPAPPGHAEMARPGLLSIRHSGVRGHTGTLPEDL